MTQVNGTSELILRSTTPDSGWKRQDRKRQADALVALHGSMRLEVGPRNGPHGPFWAFGLFL